MHHLRRLREPGKDILLVGHTDAAAGEAMQLHSLTDRTRLLTNSEVVAISPTFRRRLEGAGIPVIHDHIGEAIGADGEPPGHAGVRPAVTAGLHHRD